MSTNPKQVKIYRKRQSSKQPILVVDDEFDIVNIIRLGLNKHNFDVCGYTDPLLALEHFKDNYNKIDLVFRPKIKVLLMSAFDVIGDSEFSTHSRKYEIDGFLQKPISIKKLNSIIQSYMMKN